MNLFKSNLRIFSLLTIISLSILTSCTKDAQETDTPFTEPELSTIEVEAIKNGSIKIFLPEKIALDSDETIAYLHSLSANKLNQHLLTDKIAHFLISTNNFEKFHIDNPEYTLLSMDDLYKYAPDNVDEFEDYEPYSENNITLRGCTTVAESCYGSTLIETDKCCSEFWFASWGCVYEIDYTYNSSECNDPCSNVACGFNQYCSNGYCYDVPTCSPPCNSNEECVGTTCVPR